MASNGRLSGFGNGIKINDRLPGNRPNPHYSLVVFWLIPQREISIGFSKIPRGHTRREPDHSRKRPRPISGHESTATTPQGLVRLSTNNRGQTARRVASRSISYQCIFAHDLAAVADLRDYNIWCT